MLGDEGWSVAISEGRTRPSEDAITYATFLVQGVQERSAEIDERAGTLPQGEPDFDRIEELAASIKAVPSAITTISGRVPRRRRFLITSSPPRGLLPHRASTSNPARASGRAAPCITESPSAEAVCPSHRSRNCRSWSAPSLLTRRR